MFFGCCFFTFFLLSTHPKERGKPHNVLIHLSVLLNLLFVTLNPPKNDSF